MVLAKEIEQICTNRESFDFFGVRVSNKMASHHFSQSSCGSGKSSRSHSSCPGFATDQLRVWPWNISLLLSGPSVLSLRWRARWGDLSCLWLLKSLMLWRPWVFVTLQPHHHKRSKDEKVGAKKGQITPLKASASKHQGSGGGLYSQ